jgi:DNA-binding CsgD family transcriptional regulator
LPGEAITRFFQTRDELSFRNIRRALWPILLVFPLSVIMGNLRYYDHSIVLAGFKSSELMLFLLGLGWIILTRTPKRMIIPLLRLAAVVSAVLLPFQFFMPLGLERLVLYLIFKFFNGLSAACAFYLFCFVLNNVERLAGMVIIQLYYGFYYTAWTAFPVVHMAGETWGGAIVTAVFLVVVFFCGTEQRSNLALEINTESDGRGSGVPYVIGLSVVHYMIMCMLNYIEWAENGVSILAFGLGTFISIGLIITIQLLNGRNALYIWILFLTLSLLGLGALLYDRPITFISGSFTYGLGDGLGYIIIYYMCAGAIKRSKSLRMFRFYCSAFFIEYFAISGLFSFYFNFFDESNKFLAFGVVLVLVSLSFLLMPIMQKKLFEADWTDGLYLRDMEEYSKPFAETEALNVKDQLNLTAREQEIFTMLLTGMAPKEIAHTLKVSYYTVDFHRKNLYRKLGIQSRAELFSRYSAKSN